MAEKTATFVVKLDDEVSSPAKASADALEGLRSKIESSQAAIKNMVAAERALKGSTEEIKTAKADLRSKIDAERAAVSASNLELLKQGRTYESLAASAKKAAIEKAKLAAKGEADALARAKEKTDALSGALSEAGGPLAMVQDKFAAFTGLAGGAAGPIGLAVFAVGALVGVLTALSAALIGGTIEFLKWAIVGADAARTAALTREAWTGSAQQAEYLGKHIDDLAKKVPTSTAALQDLSVSLIKSKFSGQTLIDSMNAIGQASAALGDDVGTKLRGMLERGLLPNGAEGRFFVTPQDLMGTRLTFEEVVKSLAKTTKKSVAQAKQELLAGRVKLADGAAALREAVEQKFGKLNARKMLSLDNLKGTLEKNLGNLTKDIKVEPLLEAFGKLLHMLDDSTDTGAALKKIVTYVGQDLIDALKGAAPYAEEFFYGFLTGALDVGTAFYTMRNAIEDNLDVDFSSFGYEFDAFEAAKIVVWGLAAAIGGLAAGLAFLAVVAVLPFAPFIAFGVAAYVAYQKITSIDWESAGKSIVDGIVNGLKSGAAFLIDGVRELALKAKDTFKEVLGIHSPSAVFRDEGRQIPAGAALGVRQGTADVGNAIGAMALSGGVDGAAGQVPAGAASSRAMTLHVHLHAEGASADAVKAFDDAGLLAKVTKVVEDALVGAGVPIMQGVPT